MEAKHFAKKLGINDRIQHLARNPAFITIKDHKKNFNSKLPCCLINPSKSKLGKVFKQKLEKLTEQSNGTTYKSKSLEKLKKCYKMVHSIRK